MNLNRLNSFSDDFISGFESSAPNGYSAELDCSEGNLSPWCLPWLWERTEEWFCPELSAYEMGRKYAEKIYPTRRKTSPFRGRI